MSLTERADASTVWKEFTTPEGKKYFYNKVTKQSKWTIPHELKLACEHAEKMAVQVIQLENVVASESPVVANVSSFETPSTSSSATLGVAASLVSVTHIVSVANTLSVSGSLSSHAGHSAVSTKAAGINSLVATVPLLPVSDSGNAGLVTTTTTMTSFENSSPRDVADSANGALIQDLEEAKNGVARAWKMNTSLSEEKTAEDGLVYKNKQEAKKSI